MRRLTENFSIYSLISIRVRAFSSLKRNEANTLASSVFPTPVGPAKRKEPKGRFSSPMPVLLRLIALLTALMASSWPMTRSPRVSSRWRYFSISEESILETGMPVQLETIWAISSSPTSSLKRRWVPSLVSRSLPCSSISLEREGIKPCLISAARARLPSRSLCTSSTLSCSSWAFFSRIEEIALFSPCHCSSNLLR